MIKVLQYFGMCGLPPRPDVSHQLSEQDRADMQLLYCVHTLMLG